MFGEIVARLLGSGADAWLGASEQRRLADIARGEGKAFGALRVASGEVADLTTTWRGIEVRPLAGCISFELQRVPVTGVRSRSEPLSRREVCSVPLGQFEILVLDVPDGVLEWAILPEDAEWVREKLSG